jgi:hypothetical protein
MAWRVIDAAVPSRVDGQEICRLRPVEETLTLEKKTAETVRPVN